jgi:hypothetical protein
MGDLYKRTSHKPFSADYKTKPKHPLSTRIVKTPLPAGEFFFESDYP